MRIQRTSEFGRTCVQRRIDDTTFDSDRQLRSDFAKENKESVLKEVYGKLGKPTYRWTRHSTSSDAWTDGTPLSPELSFRLDESAGELIRGEKQPPIITAVDPAWLQQLQFCSSDRKLPRLSFSSPALRGDFAFVETSFVCGGLCGHGTLYALRRTGAGWEIVSAIVTWVS